MKNQEELTFNEGFVDGTPILLGYFSTAVAFGLICRNINLTLIESTLISLTSFAGSGQFLTVNLLSAGALIVELFISVMLVNARYIFMGMAINTHLSKEVKGFKRCLIAFGTTDEVFSVSTLKCKELNFPYMFGLQLSSYTGWVIGTTVGYVAGIFLPPDLQLAMGVTLYAMFACLWAGEVADGGFPVLLIGIISALINSILFCIVGLAAGWSFVISMITATIIGAFIIPDKSIQQEAQVLKQEQPLNEKILAEEESSCLQ